MEIRLLQQDESAIRIVGYEIRDANERHLALLGETMDLLKPCTSNATLKNTVVLFCVHVQWLVVDRWTGLKGMGRWGWVLGK